MLLDVAIWPNLWGTMVECWKLGLHRRCTCERSFKAIIYPLATSRTLCLCCEQKDFPGIWVCNHKEWFKNTCCIIIFCLELLLKIQGGSGITQNRSSCEDCKEFVADWYAIFPIMVAIPLQEYCMWTRSEGKLVNNPEMEKNLCSRCGLHWSWCQWNPQKHDYRQDLSPVCKEPFFIWRNRCCTFIATVYWLLIVGVSGLESNSFVLRDPDIPKLGVYCLFQHGVVHYCKIDTKEMFNQMLHHVMIQFIIFN